MNYKELAAKNIAEIEAIETTERFLAEKKAALYMEHTRNLKAHAIHMIKADIDLYVTDGVPTREQVQRACEAYHKKNEAELSFITAEKFFRAVLAETVIRLEA